MSKSQKQSEHYRELADWSQLPTAPVVSVYMATYNHEKYLCQAIQGVVDQVCDFSFELIIGEDCSTDASLSIAETWRAEYPGIIRIVVGRKNVGMIKNSTRCLGLCRGQYIAFCEGDDYWHRPDKLQRQIHVMRHDCNVAMCHTDYDRAVGLVRKKGAHSKNKSRNLAVGEAYEKLLHDWTVKTATAVYRADVLRQFLASRYNNPAWPFGDYNKMLFASVHGRIAYIPISTATWRRVRGSMTNSGYLRSLDLGLAYLQCREWFMEEFPVAPSVQESVRKESYKRVRNRAIMAGDLGNLREICEWARRVGIENSRNREIMGRLIIQSGVGLSVLRFFDRVWLIDLIRELRRLVRNAFGQSSGEVIE